MYREEQKCARNQISKSTTCTTLILFTLIQIFKPQKPAWFLSDWEVTGAQSAVNITVLLLVTPAGPGSCWQRENHRLSHIYAFKVSQLGFSPFIALEVPGPSVSGLCVSLADAEDSHKAEGEPVAPQNYPCRSTTVESEPSGSKTILVKNYFLFRTKKEVPVD